MADRRPPVIYKRDDPPGPGHATKAPATQLPPPPPAHRSHRQRPAVSEKSTAVREPQVKIGPPPPPRQHPVPAKTSIPTSHAGVPPHLPPQASPSLTQQGPVPTPAYLSVSEQPHAYGGESLTAPTPPSFSPQQVQGPVLATAPASASPNFMSKLESGLVGINEPHEKYQDYKLCVEVSTVLLVISCLAIASWSCLCFAIFFSKKVRKRNEEEDYLSARTCSCCTLCCLITAVVFPIMIILVGTIAGTTAQK